MADPEQAAIARGLDLLAQAVETNNERLSVIEGQLAQLIEALAPREGERHPLHDVLERIVHLQEQADAKLDAILARLPTRPNGGAAG